LELKQYLSLLWRWLWLLLSSVVLAGTVAFVLSQRMAPVYAASTTLLINQAPVSSAAPDYNSLLVSERLAQTYGELLHKRPVLQTVITNLKLNTDTEELAKRIKVAIVRNTQFIVLTAEDTDPQLAANIANEVVNVFSQQNRELRMNRYVGSRQSLQGELAKIQADIDDTQARLEAIGTPAKPDQMNEHRQLQTLLDQHRMNYETMLKSLGEIRLAEAQMTADLSVVEAAQLEPKPIRPRTLLNTLLAAILGGLFALGLAFLVEYFDDTVKSREDAEKLIGVPTLAAIVQFKGPKLDNKLATILQLPKDIGCSEQILNSQQSQNRSKQLLSPAVVHSKARARRQRILRLFLHRLASASFL
jgi:capsular polysaccharide biosynthesis protein